MKRLLVLYSEFMPYNKAAFEKLSALYSVEVIVLHWSKKKITPYIDNSDVLKMISSDNYSTNQILEIANNFDPDAIFISGWMDNRYISVAKSFKKRNKIIICGFDSQFKRGLFSSIKDLVRRLQIHAAFTHAFVPGIRQYEKALRLGFEKKRISMGALTADIDLFEKSKIHLRSKKILFVGRLEYEKGIDRLIFAFNKIIESNIELSDWELIIAGTGSYEKNITSQKNVILLGFIPQEEIAKLVQDAGFFCLPSRHEPWGVIIHEMVASGLPILCSDACGAADEFVVDNYNGCVFINDSDEDFIYKMTLMMKKSQEELLTMSLNSQKMSYGNSPEMWAHRLINICNKFSD